MKTTRILVATAVLIAASTADAGAQRFLDRLGKTVERAAENAVLRQAEKRTEQAVDGAIDGTIDAAGNAIEGDGQQQQQQAPPPATGAMPGGAMPAGGADPAQAPAAVPQSLEMTYAKSDFVPGDEIIFEDDVTGEQLGEFPSQWDLLHGVVEIAQINGENVILCVSQDDPVIVPLMKDMKSYLPEMFTLEFDFWVGPYSQKDGNNPENKYHVRFYKAESSNRVQEIVFSNWYYNADDFRSSMSWNYESISGDDRTGTDDSYRTIQNAWNHFAISFNQRAMKVYINGVRYANIPNTVAPGYFDIMFYRTGGYFTNSTSIRNVRIAKGAVPLYDRMMSEGKFITYGITFDVGKSTIKPESMGEINRIVTLMTENPDLKFSVEGHTDSTGNAASNQTLSEARSAAIVDKLVELGIAADRLSASGKGAGTPIADNATDEGRAKNRRVEFVKQ
jgi:outer membrane protein OmpA-like peptidoglycan-associated protein